MDKEEHIKGKTQVYSKLADKKCDSTGQTVNIRVAKIGVFFTFHIENLLAIFF